MAFRKIMLILLVGLIYVSTARIIDSNESKSSEEFDEMTELLGEIESSCRKRTGSNETYEKLALYADQIENCFMSKFDVEVFPNDLDNLNESTRTKFFSKYCPQFHACLSCFEPLTTEYRKCMDPEEVKYLDIVVNMLPQGLNLACNDNGQMFFTDDSNLKKCVDNFIVHVEKCIGKISNATNAMTLSKYSPKQCGELAEFRECFRQQMVECKASGLIDVLDLFYRPMVKASWCKNHIRMQEIPQIERNEGI